MDGGNRNAFDVANTAWSFATMDAKAPELFKEIEKQAPRLVKDCRMPQDIANTAWAAVTLGHSAPALVRRLIGTMICTMSCASN